MSICLAQILSLISYSLIKLFDVNHFIPMPLSENDNKLTIYSAPKGSK